MTDVAPTPKAEASGPQKPTEFLVSSAPHLSENRTTPSIMLDVIIGMVPMVIASVVWFGFRAISMVIVTVAGCLLAEAIGNKMRGKSMLSLRDGSAVVTGIILALSLPSNLWLYMAFVGGFVAIALAKAVFGGLGHNLFNPAMVGRAFLMLCFPAALVSFAPTQQMMDDAKMAKALELNVEVSELSQSDIDSITAATPLSLAGEYKSNIQQTRAAEAAEKTDKATALKAKAEKVSAAMPTGKDLFLGNVAGSLGETSALAALIGGLFLVFRGTADWRMPIGVIGGALAVAFLVQLTSDGLVQSPLFYLNSGALMFGAFFIATDYVGAPITPNGRWIFAIGVGVLLMVIRVFGSYPEGFMFAILIMNTATPLIERWTTPVPYGGHVAKA